MIKKFLWFVFGLFVILNSILALQAYRNSYFYETNKVPFRNFKNLSVLDKIEIAILGPKVPKRPILDFPKRKYETINLVDLDGYRLEGWFVPVEKPKATVLLLHGHGSNKSRVVREAEQFNTMGYSVLAMDARAHGNSQGNICTIGYKETEVAKLGYEYLQNKHKELPIVMWGSSMGAAIITKSLVDYPSLKPSKIILEMPFASMEDAVKGFLRNLKIPPSPIAQTLLFWGSVERGYWAFNYKPCEYAKKITIPVLYQIGEVDVRVTKQESDLNFANLATKKKKMVVYKNAGHVSLCKHDPAVWRKEVEAFLK